MTTEYTQNFRFNLPDFRMGPWHDLVNTNTDRMDQLLMGVYGGVDTRPWTNNTIFEVGMTCIDTVDNTFWVCSVTHTSAPAPTTFAADRAAHPSYWARVVVGVAPRGEWDNAVHYLPNDMATDSLEGIIGLCKTEHTSSADPATMRTDEVYWTFLTDFGASTINAEDVIYDNTASGATAVDVQAALDYLYAAADMDADDIDALQAALGALTTRVTNVETVNSAQDIAINNGQIAITSLNTRVTNLETVGVAVTAASVSYNNVPGGEPFDDVQEGLYLCYQDILNLDDRVTDLEAAPSGASVLISDTPPVGAPDTALWWESDTGGLYIRYNDGDSAQWVAIVGAQGPQGIPGTAGTPGTWTQITQAAYNALAPPDPTKLYVVIG